MGAEAAGFGSQGVTETLEGEVLVKGWDQNSDCKRPMNEKEELESSMHGPHFERFTNEEEETSNMKAWGRKTVKGK